MHNFTCNVRGCKYRLNRRMPGNLSLYILPRNAPESLKSLWRKACMIGRLIACSDHFEDSDFIDPPTKTYSWKTGHLRKRPLKHNVVPKVRLAPKNKVSNVTPIASSDNIVVLDSDDENTDAKDSAKDAQNNPETSSGDPDKSMEVSEIEFVSCQVGSSPIQVLRKPSKTSEPNASGSNATKAPPTDASEKVQHKSLPTKSQPNTPTNNPLRKRKSTPSNIGPKTTQKHPRIPPKLPTVEGEMKKREQEAKRKSFAGKIKAETAAKVLSPVGTSRENKKLTIKAKVPTAEGEMTKKDEEVKLKSSANKIVAEPETAAKEISPEGTSGENLNVDKQILVANKNSVDQISKIKIKMKEQLKVVPKVDMNLLMQKQGLTVRKTLFIPNEVPKYLHPGIVTVKIIQGEKETLQKEQSKINNPENFEAKKVFLNGYFKKNSFAVTELVKENHPEQSEGDCSEPSKKQKKVEDLQITSVRSLHSTTPNILKRKKATSSPPQSSSSGSQSTQKKQPEIRFRRELVDNMKFGARCLVCNILIYSTEQSRLQLHISVCRGKPGNPIEQGEVYTCKTAGEANAGQELQIYQKKISPPPDYPKGDGPNFAKSKSLRDDQIQQHLKVLYEQHFLPSENSEQVEPQQDGKKLNYKIKRTSLVSQYSALPKTVESPLGKPKEIQRKDEVSTSHQTPVIQIKKVVPVRNQVITLKKVVAASCSRTKKKEDILPNITVVDKKKLLPMRTLISKNTKNVAIPGPLPIIRTVESLYKNPDPPKDEDNAPRNEEGSNEASYVENDDDDVIAVPQTVEVIDIESESEDEREPPVNVSKCCEETCEYSDMCNQLRIKKKELEQMMNNLVAENKICEYNVTKILNRHDSTKDFLENVSSILTQTQKDIFFGLKNRVVWHHEEIQSAIVLRNLSNDLYLYLREELKYPLPSLASLVKWEMGFPIQAQGLREFADDYRNSQSDDEIDVNDIKIELD